MIINNFVEQRLSFSFEILVIFLWWFNENCWENLNVLSAMAGNL